MKIPYIIPSFRGGISDESDKGIAGAFKYGYACSIHDKNDSLTCNESMQTIDGGTVSTLINFFVPASDGSTYCFGATGSIYARSGDGAWNFVYNDENGAIKGAYEWQLSDGNNYLFWATATSIARVAMNGSLPVPWVAGTATQNYKTTLEAVDWHTMIEAGGSLNIANGPYIATIDYAGNFNAIATNIRPGNVINTLEERDDYTIMGSGREDESEKGHLWSWTPTANNYIQKKKIPVKGINALITTEIPLLQGGSDGEIFYSDFVNTTPVHAIPGGGKVNPGGVSIYNDLAVFGFYGGDNPGLWTYGRRLKNRPYVLNYGYRLAGTVNGSSVSTIGAVAVINGEILCSYGMSDGSTSTYQVDSSSSTTKATARYESLEFTSKAPHIAKSFNSIKLSLTPMPASTSLSVIYKTDKDNTDYDTGLGLGWRYAVFGGGSTTFSTTGATECEARISASARILELGAILTPNGTDEPEVLSVTTLFEGNQIYGKGSL